MITDEVLELVRGRSSPGVLILDRENKLLYANREALKLLNDSHEIPQEVRSLCEQMKASVSETRGEPDYNANCAMLRREGESTWSMRAFLIGAQSKGRPATHVMVLIEKVTEQHGVNLKKARAQYGLSDREIEVVELIAKGLPNKEIGSKLFVSEHTVKDHIKNIMRKMNAASRSEIIYILK